MIPLTANDNGLPDIGAEPEISLLRVRNDTSGLFCASCGCMCAASVSGRRMCVCEVPLAALADARIVTLGGALVSEGVSLGALHAVQAVWIESQVPACRCDHARILTAAALLDRNPDPDDIEIEAALTGPCCGVRPQALRAIRLLIERMKAW
jgi:aerobic-type carbon monoxide dehydrogenase small subunit (CoxS/CutS family)